MALELSQLSRVWSDGSAAIPLAAALVVVRAAGNVCRPVDRAALEIYRAASKNFGVVLKSLEWSATEA